MYHFSKKLKIFAIALIVLGALGTAISFYNTPKSLEEVKAIMAQESSYHGGHNDDSHAKHSTDKNTHDSEHNNVEEVTNHVKKDSVQHHEKLEGQNSQQGNSTEDVKEEGETHQEVVSDKEKTEDSHSVQNAEEHVKADSEAVHHASNEAHSSTEHHGDEHAEHVFHQMQNRPVSAFYVALLFSLGITLLVLAFYASQRVAHAGWSVAIFRVFEAITNNLHYVSIVMLLFIVGTVMHKFHLFPWMKEGTFDPANPNYDAVIDAKKWWMNLPGWTIRGVFYLLGWNVFRYIIRKKSIKQDNGDLKLHKNLYNISVGFIAFFLITESMMSWDWIMGIDPHWFSTLFGWYVLATFLVSALTVVAIVTIYLRSKGALPSVNDSHIHDLAKFMFGFSVFWTYLWFAQFMLIWYSDMPEETTYFLQRFNDYKVPFLSMVVANFIFPVLLLINSDFKSIPWLVVLGGIVILIGHYVDLYVMIMPGTVGGQNGFGIGEISGLLFFVGLFIYATFSAFGKANPIPEGNPFLQESKTHHYYNIKHRGEDDSHH